MFERFAVYITADRKSVLRVSSMQKKIRLMCVAECSGGVNRYLHSLFKYLDHKEFEIIFVCSQNYKPDEFVDIVDVVAQIPMEHAIKKGDLTTVIQIRKLIKQYRPDIVYAHSSKAGALVRLANVATKVTCIYNPHGWAFNMQEGHISRIVYRYLEKVMAFFCDKIVCISEAERQSALQNRICPDQKLKVIYNGIDIEEYQMIEKERVSREQLHIPRDAFVIGMVGRLSKQKAPDIFIQMADLVCKNIPNAYFIMVGTGVMQDQILKYAESNNLMDRLRITGWVTNPLVYIELFDVAVLLSRWEGFGLVIPEYMICKKPVIATAVDAIPNLIQDYKNGLLVPMDDVDAASKAVLELYNDNALQSQLVQNALRDVYEKFDARRVAREHERLFKSLRVQ